MLKTSIGNDSAVISRTIIIEATKGQSCKHGRSSKIKEFHYSSQASVRTKAFGIGESRDSVRVFVSRLVMQTSCKVVALFSLMN
ncbi:hypothetical protein KIN20_018687 [Parelaphostrongylus tenuis]|uniref:Uncharacterized protein n=1 Tax=Parelaphostrongylus tenuis TaxID=148309 RepID=A0AAD5N4J5_PARTN|nr:hypothetical protein KIN20_018687 [Parelaphostrongylus tenuis]